MSWAAAFGFIRGLIYLLVSAVFLEVVVGVLRIVVCMSLVVSEAGPLLLFGRVLEFCVMLRIELLVVLLVWVYVSIGFV